MNVLIAMLALVLVGLMVILSLLVLYILIIILDYFCDGRLKRYYKELTSVSRDP